MSVQKKRKILFLYAVPNTGHAQAAAALAQAFEKTGRWETSQDYVMRYVPGVGQAVYKTYQWIIGSHQSVWGKLHGSASYAPLLQGFEKWFAGVERPFARAVLRKHKPDVVFATNVLPLRMLANLKKHGKFDLPLFALTTDLWAHRYWAHPGIDQYFAASAHAEKDLQKQGVSARKIQVTGIPVRGEFGLPVDKAAVRAKLGLRKDALTILVMGGANGIFPLTRIFQWALSESKLANVQWVFVFGKNAEALKQCKRELGAKHRGRFALLGYTHDVPQLMGAADLLLSKAGGLSTSEALVRHLPMLIYRPTLGQEIGNTQTLTDAGAAVYAPHFADVQRLLIDLAQHPRKLSTMQAATAILARPHAAEDVVGGVERYLAS